MFIPPLLNEKQEKHKPTMKFPSSYSFSQPVRHVKRTNGEEDGEKEITSNMFQANCCNHIIQSGNQEMRKAQQVIRTWKIVFAQVKYTSNHVEFVICDRDLCNFRERLWQLFNLNFRTNKKHIFANFFSDRRS